LRSSLEIGCIVSAKPLQSTTYSASSRQLHEPWFVTWYVPLTGLSAKYVSRSTLIARAKSIV